MNWYLEVLKKYAVFSGRARRKEYWMFALFSTLFTIAAMILDNVLGIAGSQGCGPIYGLYCLALLIPSLAVSFRRLHDIGKSGWFLLILLIPLIGAIWFLVLVCKDSLPGDNKYGSNPMKKVIGKGVVRSFFDSIQSVSFDKVLMKTASELNANLPMMIDKETRLDNTFGGPGKKFTYYYTMINYAAEEIEKFAFDTDVAPTLRQNAINNKELNLMLKKGVTVVYYYKGNDGKFITDIVITPSDCGY